MDNPDLAELIIGRGLLFVTLIPAGVLLIWVARAGADGRLKRNMLAGIRVRSTMTSESAWLAAHQASRWHTEAAGWCSLAAGLFVLLPVPIGTVGVVVLVGVGVMLALVVYGAVVGSRAARNATVSGNSESATESER